VVRHGVPPPKQSYFQNRTKLNKGRVSQVLCDYRFKMSSKQYRTYPARYGLVDRTQLPPWQVWTGGLDTAARYGLVDRTQQPGMDWWIGHSSHPGRHGLVDRTQPSPSQIWTGGQDTAPTQPGRDRWIGHSSHPARYGLVDRTSPSQVWTGG
jgi:hypothetical protein